MEGLTLGAIVASIIATILIGLVVALKNHLQRKNVSTASTDLATRILEYLDTSAMPKTNLVISKSKQLGDQLVRYYRSDSPFDKGLREELQALLEEIIAELEPYISNLNAARPELDLLKDAVVEYDAGLKRRLQIIRHLCAPPNPSTMDAGHVREQLLSQNCIPNDLLQSARGEARLFLRGYGVNWLQRRRYKREIRKKLSGEMKSRIAKEYRAVLRQTAFANRK